MAEKFDSIDDYIAAQSSDVQPILAEIRRRVHATAPGLDEAIAYQIPTFRLKGRNVLHMAAWKQHVSIYPIPEGDADLDTAVNPYRAGKGTLKFALGTPFPFELVDRLAAAAVAGRS